MHDFVYNSYTKFEVSLLKTYREITTYISTFPTSVAVTLEVAEGHQIWHGSVKLIGCNHNGKVLQIICLLNSL